MGKDVQLFFLVVHVNRAYIAVVIIDRKAVALCHRKGCLKCLKASVSKGSSGPVGILCTVNPAELYNILQHFLFMFINITADFLFIHS